MYDPNHPRASSSSASAPVKARSGWKRRIAAITNATRTAMSNITIAERLRDNVLAGSFCTLLFAPVIPFLRLDAIQFFAISTATGIAMDVINVTISIVRTLREQAQKGST